MEIDNEIKEQTSCKKGFSCLDTECKSCCKVVNCINDKVHFINFTSKDYCSFKMSFGYSDICNCPTRKELFNKYGL